MDLIEPYADLDLEDATLVIALKGWVDGGAVASQSGEYLAGDGPTVARFRADGIFEYGTRRPLIAFDSGRSAEVLWPDLVIRHNRLDDRDLLILVGDEPLAGWQGVVSDLTDLAAGSGVRRLVTLGALPSQVAHTKPTPLLITSNDDALQASGVPGGRFVVPAAAANVIDHHLSQNLEIPAVGFWAQVPHYVSGVYWPAVSVIVERVAMYLGAQIDTSRLEREAKEMIARLDQAVAERPEAQEMLAQMEDAQQTFEETLGQDLAGEVEDFLRSMGDDEENPFG
jgi:predicted ATP-grasp superfamily ATP-dependent carboligase